MGVSEVAGKKRLMRYPPENHYPRTESEQPGFFSWPAGQRGDMKWFDDQLHAAVNERVYGDAKAFGERNPEARATRTGQPRTEIPLSDIYLEPIPQTSVDVRAGRDPRYGVVWFEDRGGVRVMQSAPGMVFFGDRAAAEAKQKEIRRADTYEKAQKKIDDQTAQEQAVSQEAARARGIVDQVIKPSLNLQIVD